MRNPFEQNWNQPLHAEVQRAEKRLPYTVEVIGGKEELAAWKVSQEAEWAKWRKEADERSNTRRQIAMALVRDQSANPTDADVDEMRRVKAMYENQRKKDPSVGAAIDQHIEAIEKKSLTQKATQIISNFWNQAFDND